MQAGFSLPHENGLLHSTCAAPPVPSVRVLASGPRLSVSPHPPCPVPVAAWAGNRVAIPRPAPPAPPAVPTPSCGSPTAPASCRPHAGTSRRGPAPWSRSAACSAWTWARCAPSASSSGESLCEPLPGRRLVAPGSWQAGLRGFPNVGLPDITKLEGRGTPGCHPQEPGWASYQTLPPALRVTVAGCDLRVAWRNSQMGPHGEQLRAASSHPRTGSAVQPVCAVAVAFRREAPLSRGGGPIVSRLVAASVLSREAQWPSHGIIAPVEDLLQAGVSPERPIYGRTGVGLTALLSVQ